MDYRLEKLLEELSNISKKYDLYIDGCGCCGSPSLTTVPPGEKSSSDLYWDYDNKKYVYKGRVPERFIPPEPESEEERRKRTEEERAHMLRMKDSFKKWADTLDLPNND